MEHVQLIHNTWDNFIIKHTNISFQNKCINTNSKKDEQIHISLHLFLSPNKRILAFASSSVAGNFR